MTATTVGLPARARRGPGAGVVWREELRKLAAQRRVLLTIVLCVAVPFWAAAALALADLTPKDTLYGRWVQSSGYALPLVVLGFSGQWVLPLLTSLIAGDVFSSEDHHGTWPTLLTRSCSRRSIFLGKVLAAGTWSVLVVALLAVCTLLAGVVVIGAQPVVSLSGSLLPADALPGLVLAAWASALPPVLAFAAFGVLVSVATRSSVVGVLAPVAVAGVLQLLALLGGLGMVRTLLPTTPFAAWRGLLSEPVYLGPLVQGAAVSTAYAVACLAAAWAVFRRRDLDGS